MAMRLLEIFEVQLDANNVRELDELQDWTRVNIIRIGLHIITLFYSQKSRIGFHADPSLKRVCR